MSRTFVLGAGFSASAQFPLVGELKERIIKFLDESKRCDPAYAAHLEPRSGWAQGEFYVGLREVDPQNNLQFEELLIGLESRIAKAALRDDPCHCTLRLLKMGCASYLWKVHGSTPKLPACYAKFAERISATMPNAHADAIVSFNWDVVIEQALTSASGLPWSYSKCFPGVPVLKPHGSINWSSHGAEGYQGDRAWQPIGPGSKLSFNASARFSDPYRQGVNEDFRYMIFPGGASSSLEPNQELIWKEIEDVISYREAIVFIGYSLPVYDSTAVGRLQWLAKGKEIEVYNPSAEHLSMYRKVFGPQADIHAVSFEKSIYAAPVGSAI